ncbi:hypothetical protein ADUPG1_013121, partial [Aduncisulcus paluster]
MAEPTSKEHIEDALRLLKTHSDEETYSVVDFLQYCKDAEKDGESASPPIESLENLQIFKESDEIGLEDEELSTGCLHEDVVGNILQLTQVKSRNFDGKDDINDERPEFQPKDPRFIHSEMGMTEGKDHMEQSLEREDEEEKLQSEPESGNNDEVIDNKEGILSGDSSPGDRHDIVKSEIVEPSTFTQSTPPSAFDTFSSKKPQRKQMVSHQSLLSTAPPKHSSLNTPDSIEFPGFNETRDVSNKDIITHSDELDGSSSFHQQSQIPSQESSHKPPASSTHPLSHEYSEEKGVAPISRPQPHIPHDDQAEVLVRGSPVPLAHVHAPAALEMQLELERVKDDLEQSVKREEMLRECISGLLTGLRTGISDSHELITVKDKIHKQEGYEEEEEEEEEEESVAREVQVSTVQSSSLTFAPDIISSVPDDIRTSIERMHNTINYLNSSLTSGILSMNPSLELMLCTFSQGQQRLSSAYHLLHGGVEDLVRHSLSVEKEAEDTRTQCQKELKVSQRQRTDLETELKQEHKDLMGIDKAKDLEIKKLKFLLEQKESALKYAHASARDAHQAKSELEDNVSMLTADVQKERDKFFCLEVENKLLRDKLLELTHIDMLPPAPCLTTSYQAGSDDETTSQVSQSLSHSQFGLRKSTIDEMRLSSLAQSASSPVIGRALSKEAESLVSSSVHSPVQKFDVPSFLLRTREVRKMEGQDRLGRERGRDEKERMLLLKKRRQDPRSLTELNADENFPFYAVEQIPSQKSHFMRISYYNTWTKDLKRHSVKPSETEEEKNIRVLVESYVRSYAERNVFLHFERRVDKANKYIWFTGSKEPKKRILLFISYSGKEQKNQKMKQMKRYESGHKFVSQSGCNVRGKLFVRVESLKYTLPDDNVEQYFNVKSNSQFEIDTLPSSLSSFSVFLSHGSSLYLKCVDGYFSNNSIITLPYKGSIESYDSNSNIYSHSITVLGSATEYVQDPVLFPSFYDVSTLPTLLSSSEEVSIPIYERFVAYDRDDGSLNTFFSQSPSSLGSVFLQSPLPVGLSSYIAAQSVVILCDPTLTSISVVFIGERSRVVLMVNISNVDGTILTDECSSLSGGLKNGDEGVYIELSDSVEGEILFSLSISDIGDINVYSDLLHLSVSFVSPEKAALNADMRRPFISASPYLSDYKIVHSGGSSCSIGDDLPCSLIFGRIDAFSRHSLSSRFEFELDETLVNGLGNMIQDPDLYGVTLQSLSEDTRSTVNYTQKDPLSVIYSPRRIGRLIGVEWNNYQMTGTDGVKYNVNSLLSYVLPYLDLASGSGAVDGFSDGDSVPEELIAQSKIVFITPLEDSHDMHECHCVYYDSDMFIVFSSYKYGYYNSTITIDGVISLQMNFPELVRVGASVTSIMVIQLADDDGGLIISPLQSASSLDSIDPDSLVFTTVY